MRILNIETETKPDVPSENKDPEVSEAIAREGDWNFSKSILNKLSQQVFDLNYENPISLRGKLDISEDIELFVCKLKNDKTWIAGYWEEIYDENTKRTERKFVIVFRIQMEIVNSIGQKFGYSKLYQVKELMVDQSLRGLGISYFMYKWLVNNNDFNILGDRVQYFGARKLWAKLSQSMDIQVDAIDRKTTELLERGIKLYHGSYDHEFDKRVWSYDLEKADTQLVLTRVLN